MSSASEKNLPQKKLHREEEGLQDSLGKRLKLQPISAEHLLSTTESSLRFDSHSASSALLLRPQSQLVQTQSSDEDEEEDSEEEEEDSEEEEEASYPVNSISQSRLIDSLNKLNKTLNKKIKEKIQINQSQADQIQINQLQAEQKKINDMMMIHGDGFCNTLSLQFAKTILQTYDGAGRFYKTKLQEINTVISLEADVCSTDISLGNIQKAQQVLRSIVASNDINQWDDENDQGHKSFKQMLLESSNADTAKIIARYQESKHFYVATHDALFAWVKQAQHGEFLIIHSIEHITLGYAQQHPVLNEMIVGFYDSNLDNNGINNIIIRKQTTFRLSDLQKFHVVGKDTTVLECSILSLDEHSAFHVPSHYDTATPGFSEINHQILELALVVNDVSPIRELYSLITAEQQEALLMSTTCDTPHGMIDIFTFAISQQIHLDAVKALFQIQNKQLIANFLIRECTGEATMPLHFAMENNARDKANYLFELYQEHDLLEFIRDHNDISIFYIAVEKGFWHIARSLFDACKDDDMKIHLLSQSYDHEKGDEQAFQQLEKQLQYLRNELQTNPLDALIQQKLEVCTFLYAESNRLQLDLICTRSEDEGENVESADNVILEFPQLDPEDVAAINAMIGESNGVE